MFQAGCILNICRQGLNHSFRNPNLVRSIPKGINPKQIRTQNDKKSKQGFGTFVFMISNLFRASYFGFMGEAGSQRVDGSMKAH